MLLAGCCHMVHQANPKGTVIILNGTSGVGKSSIQKELVELFDETYLKIGIDNFMVGVLPEKYITGTTPNKEKVWSSSWSKTDSNKPIFHLTFGDDGRKIIAGMHYAIAAYAQAGNNIVVDYILYDHAWLAELKKALKDFRVYFIGINAPLDIVEQREKDRATSPQGHARSIYDTVHTGCTYDLSLDTGSMSAHEAALLIKKFVEKNPTPQAFKS